MLKLPIQRMIDSSPITYNLISKKKVKSFMSTSQPHEKALISQFDEPKLSAEQRLLYKVYELFEPAKLPAHLKQASPTLKKSATPELLELIHELAENYSTLAASTKVEVEKYIRLKKVGNSIKVEYPTDLEG